MNKFLLLLYLLINSQFSTCIFFAYFGCFLVAYMRIFWNFLGAYIPDPTNNEFAEYIEEIRSKMIKGYAVVHLWEMKLGNKSMGHLSLTLPGIGDETHISFFPANTSKQNIITSAKSQTLMQDMEEEGRKPDKQLYIDITKLDIDEMKKWWKIYMNENNGTKYNLLTHNCAIVVINALMAGKFVENEAFESFNKFIKNLNSQILEDLYTSLVGRMELMEKEDRKPEDWWLYIDITQQDIDQMNENEWWMDEEYMDGNIETEYKLELFKEFIKNLNSHALKILHIYLMRIKKDMEAKAEALKSFKEIIKNLNSLKMRLMEDMNAEGRKPDDLLNIDIRKLDINPMKEWWQNYMDGNTETELPIKWFDKRLPILAFEWIKKINDCYIYWFIKLE